MPRVPPVTTATLPVRSNRSTSAPPVAWARLAAGLLSHPSQPVRSVSAHQFRMRRSLPRGDSIGGRLHRREKLMTAQSNWQAEAGIGPRRPVSQGPSGWAAWISFAGVLLVVVGVLQVMQGLAALLDDG